jgi:hypothetical protein
MLDACASLQVYNCIAIDDNHDFLVVLMMMMLIIIVIALCVVFTVEG